MAVPPAGTSTGRWVNYTRNLAARCSLALTLPFCNNLLNKRNLQNQIRRCEREQLTPNALGEKIGMTVKQRSGSLADGHFAVAKYELLLASSNERCKCK